MSDRETIEVYNDQVEAYATNFASDSPDETLLKFIQQVPSGGLVLDLGCGPASSSNWMREHGLNVDPVDASPEMVRLANETYDISARVALFDDIKEIDQYDGVWANFCLLHASREAFPGHLEQIHNALKPAGYFHIGLKLGAGSKRDRLGRLYTFYEEPELLEYLSQAGFDVKSTNKGKDVGLAGTLDPWITVLSQTQK